MRERFRRFMAGRYGTDALNQFLSIVSIVLLLVALLTRVNLFTWVGMGVLIWCYYRTFSRNIPKRTEENYKFYTLKQQLEGKVRSLKEQWANRKLYHYYRCPQCRQKPRVPRGRGRIQTLLPPVRHPVYQKELRDHVWLCDPKSIRNDPRTAGPVPR